ncbi:hypothetical protein [Verrucomicrobium sp. 3C]|uniref:hypothetical protein n=1 Tax=Verrucomicrobium sp. 3C TaxID=1134055 RepID=UPI000377ACC8|nr:hypothetical protein [Verrucomicrobium sp. 3C]
MKKRTIIVLALALLSRSGFLRAAELPAGTDAPAATPTDAPSSWQDKLADLLKRDSELNKKVDQLDQAIRQKHDDLARSLAKELQTERSAFHHDLQQVKDALQNGIRGAAQSLGQGAGQIKEEATKLQEALERAAQQEGAANRPTSSSQP